PVPARGPMPAPPTKPMHGAPSTRRMTHRCSVGAASVLVLGPCHALGRAPHLNAGFVLRLRPDPYVAQLMTHIGGTRCAPPTEMACATGTLESDERKAYGAGACCRCEGSGLYGPAG